MIQAENRVRALPYDERVIAEVVAGSDPERWLAVTYAAKRARPALAALFALDISLGRLVASTAEPMIGGMRLAWWREALERLHLSPVPGEPVLQALAAELVGKNSEVAAQLAAMTDGWLALIEVEQLDTAALETHARERGERLFRLAADVLGVEGCTGTIERLGRGWALVDLASRLSQTGARLEAAAAAVEALASGPGSVPRRARPLVALAALARHDAMTRLRHRRIGSPGRQMRMLAALLTGR